MVEMLGKEISSQGGVFSAWKVQELVGGEWKDMQFNETTYEEFYRGVPYPKYNGDISHAIGFYGYHQALALAHTLAAIKAFDGIHIQVRTLEVRIKYDIKAYEIDSDVSSPHPIPDKSDQRIAP